MAKKTFKKKRKERVEELKIKPSSYLIRFAFIYLINIAILLTLTYQMGLKDSWIFAIFIIALTAKLTNTKFILDNKRIYTKEEKSKFIWGSWGIVWFLSITATILLTQLIAGKEKLAALVVTISSMDTMNFILTFGVASIVSYLVLYLMYGMQPQREFDALKRRDKI